MNDTTSAQNVVAVEQPRQNDVLRPWPGTKTGLVWDYADAIYAQRQKLGMEHPVPVIAEVNKLYSNVKDSVPATCRQQFQFWCKFHGLKEAWAARVAAEGQEVDAEKIAARKAKEEAKLKKAQESAQKAQDRAAANVKKAEEAKKKAEELAAKAQKQAADAKTKADEMLAKAQNAAKAAQASTEPAKGDKPAAK